MGGTSRIAVIDCVLGITGHIRQAAAFGFRKSLKSTTVNQQENLVLKLKRETLSSCKIGKLSAPFSYHEDITGTKAIIWCTGSHKGFQKAFFGTVERVSNNTDLRFALRVSRIAS